MLQQELHKFILTHRVIFIPLMDRLGVSQRCCVEELVPVNVAKR